MKIEIIDSPRPDDNKATDVINVRDAVKKKVKKNPFIGYVICDCGTGEYCPNRKCIPVGIASRCFIPIPK